MGGGRETEARAPQSIFMGERGRQSVPVGYHVGLRARKNWFYISLLPHCMTSIKVQLLVAQFLLLQNRDSNIYP